MEIIQQFHQFLEQAQDFSPLHSQLMNADKEQLIQIKNLLSRMDLNQGGGNQLQIQKLEQTLSENTKLIYKALKSAIDNLCSLHVYATNYVLEPANVMDFLSLYCSSMFQCASVSAISQEFSNHWYLRAFENQEITEKSIHAEIIKELQTALENSDMSMIDLEKSKVTREYIDKDYSVNIVYKFSNEKNPLFIILHYTKDNLFKKYFMEGEKREHYKAIFNFVFDVLQALNEDGNKEDTILSALDNIKLTAIELYRDYFFHYLSQQLKPFLDSEVMTTSKKDVSSLGENINLKRSLEVVVDEENRTIELKPNFPWDASKVNEKISKIWKKFDILHRRLEDQIFYQTQKLDKTKSDTLTLEYNSKGYLIFQSQSIPEEFSPIFESNDYVQIPTARSLNVSLAKNKKFFEEIQECIKQLKEGTKSIYRKRGQFDVLGYEFVGRKKDGTNELGGFSLSLFMSGQFYLKNPIIY